MHVYLSNGIMNVELHLLLTAAKRRHRITYRTLDAFVSADWRWPSFSSGRRHMKGFFSEAREKASSDAFKAMASEVLLVYPIVRHFCKTVLERLGGLEAELQSFYALCDAVDKLHGLKLGNLRPDLDALQLDSCKHGCLHQLAYGSQGVKPKHHYAHHIVHQVRRDAILLDTFVLERKHQPIKTCAQHVANTQCYERSVLSRVLIDQTRNLQTFEAANSLIGNAKAMGSTIVSKKMVWKGTTVAADDVVLVAGEDWTIAFEVRGCLQDGDVLCLVGHRLVPENAGVRPTPWSYWCGRDDRLVQFDLQAGVRLQHLQAWSVNVHRILILCASSDRL
jgi:hypothetical protein